MCSICYICINTILHRCVLHVIHYYLYIHVHIDLHIYTCITQPRFQELYTIRKSYTVDELSPYLTDLHGGPGQPRSLLELLLTYTRTVDDKFLLK